MKSISRYLIAGLCLAITLSSGCLWQPAETEFAGSLPMDKEKIRPDDGDSFSYGSTPIRVVGMDTPEIAHEEHGFYEDQPLGREASRVTREILEAAERVSFLPCGEDQYGRTLAIVFVDGELLSVKLIRLGLAYETVSHYGDNGYPELAARVLKAAEEGKKPEFEPPWKWRKAHRK